MSNHSARVSFRTARRQLLTQFERSYLLELLERHGMDVAAAAREAQLPLDKLHALLRKHTRAYVIERVHAFYGRQLRSDEARQIADRLLSLELQQASG